VTIRHFQLHIGEGFDGFEQVGSICDPLHGRLVQPTRCKCRLVLCGTGISQNQRWGTCDRTGWRFGPDGLIAESIGHFDTADYQRQLNADGKSQ
jgi:hypothetical protein